MIPLPTINGSLLEFRALDSQDTVNLPAVFTIGWNFTDDPTDPWTRRFLAFKSRDKDAVHGACNVLLTVMGSISWRLASPKIAVTAAISSSQCALANDAPLAILGRHIAAGTGWQWAPDLLGKKTHRALHRLSSGAERDAEVANKYCLNERCYDFNILILLDDIVTRGATMSEIARTVRGGYSKTHILGFALGKSESKRYAAQHGHALDNLHIPKGWQTLWKDAGRPFNDE